MIYFVRAGLGRVKIGSANDVSKRIRELQTGCPEELVLLLCLPGGREEELALHRRFEEHLVRGEWFILSPAVRQFLWEHGCRETLPPKISVDAIREAIASFDWRPEFLRSIVEALYEGKTTVASTEDPSDHYVLQLLRVYFDNEPEPTDIAALLRLYWCYFAPPQAYARLQKDAALATLNEAMKAATGIEIGPRTTPPAPVACPPPVQYNFQHA